MLCGFFLFYIHVLQLLCTRLQNVMHLFMCTVLYKTNLQLKIMTLSENVHECIIVNFCISVTGVSTYVDGWLLSYLWMVVSV